MMEHKALVPEYKDYDYSEEFIEQDPTLLEYYDKLKESTKTKNKLKRKFKKLKDNNLLNENDIVKCEELFKRLDELHKDIKNKIKKYKEALKYARIKSR